MSSSVFRRLALLVPFIALFAADLRAQTTTGRISGTVLDTSGAVLPGVTVTVREEATGLTRTATTDA
ncbi:MAG TPA: carboxypeptidase-like regulatory domain-containing protein, partial [Vicinamibacteria bacterium]